MYSFIPMASGTSCPNIVLMIRQQTKDIEQTEISGVSGRYWHALDDRRLQCDLCPRFCKLRDGQRGLCFVRARVRDEIRLTTYGSWIFLENAGA